MLLLNSKKRGKNINVLNIQFKINLECTKGLKVGYNWPFQEEREGGFSLFVVVREKVRPLLNKIKK